MHCMKFQTEGCLFPSYNFLFVLAFPIYEVRFRLDSGVYDFWVLFWFRLFISKSSKSTEKGINLILYLPKRTFKRHFKCIFKHSQNCVIDWVVQKFAHQMAIDCVYLLFNCMAWQQSSLIYQFILLTHVDVHILTLLCAYFYGSATQFLFLFGLSTTLWLRLLDVSSAPCCSMTR